MISIAEQLYQRVLESPFDDTPRLLCADAIEEAGDHARAVLIRAMIEIQNVPRCALAAGPVNEPTPGCDCRWCLINQKAREAWQANDERDARNWWPGMGGYVINAYRSIGDHSAAVVRGFVESVTLYGENWWGGPCDHAGWNDVNTCQLCRGQRFVEAEGPKLVASQPITRITFIDKRPARLDARSSDLGRPRVYGRRPRVYGWYCLQPGPDPTFSSVYRGDMLPRLIFEGCRGRPGQLDSPEHRDNYGVYPNWIDFESDQFAREAAAQSAIDWARDEAGLPKIDWTNH